MRDTIQKNPILAVILVVSAVINVILGFKAVTQSNLCDRMTRLEVKVDSLKETLDRVLDKKVAIHDANEYDTNSSAVRVGFGVGNNSREFTVYPVGERSDRVVGEIPSRLLQE